MEKRLSTRRPSRLFLRVPIRGRLSIALRRADKPEQVSVSPRIHTIVGIQFPGDSGTPGALPPRARKMRARAYDNRGDSRRQRSRECNARIKSWFIAFPRRQIRGLEEGQCTNWARARERVREERARPTGAKRKSEGERKKERDEGIPSAYTR